MRARTILGAAAVAGLAGALGGCGLSDPYNDRPATTAAARTAPARTTAVAAVAPGGTAAPTPDAAIKAVALAWGNWTSATVHAQHLRAIRLTAGAAADRLKLENRQMEDGVVSSPEDLASRASVAALTLRPGDRKRDAIVVTRERMSGLGPLGSTSDYVVTLATAERRGDGWVVTRWERQQ